MNTTWSSLLKEEQEKEYFQHLQSFVAEEYENRIVYPPKDDLYAAFNRTPYEKVRCVILGQDPYHGKGQAMGLSFSVRDGVQVPRSLKNIYKEIDAEYGCGIPESGNLSYWADQGVLLLNSILTVREGEPASHRNKGWEIFTDRVFQLVDEKESPVVFMLWGNYARSKEDLVKGGQHLVLQTAHPSPLSASRGFFGCGHFRACNEFLKAHGQEEIDWKIQP